MSDEQNREQMSHKYGGSLTDVSSVVKDGIIFSLFREERAGEVSGRAPRVSTEFIDVEDVDGYLLKFFSGDRDAAAAAKVIFEQTGHVDMSPLNLPFEVVSDLRKPRPGRVGQSR